MKRIITKFGGIWDFAVTGKGSTNEGENKNG